MLVGGWRALRQYDLKLILAYGTVSQLGFLTIVVGLRHAATPPGRLRLVAGPRLFKATLFLVVGIIDHQSGTRDIRELSHLYRKAPKLFVVALIGAASMAGLPPLLGFVAKESVYEAFIHREEASGWVGGLLLAGIVIGIHPDVRLQRPVYLGRVCGQTRPGGHRVQTCSVGLPGGAGHPGRGHRLVRAVAGSGGKRRRTRMQGFSRWIRSSRIWRSGTD